MARVRSCDIMKSLVMESNSGLTIYDFFTAYERWSIENGRSQAERDNDNHLELAFELQNFYEHWFENGSDDKEVCP